MSEPQQTPKELKELIESKNCNPILVRLAWHDSGTYDQRIKEWPARGGANGAILFDPEMNMGANAGWRRCGGGGSSSFSSCYRCSSFSTCCSCSCCLMVEVRKFHQVEIRQGFLMTLLWFSFAIH